MKKFLLISAIPFLMLCHYLYFWADNNEFVIMQHAFSIGSWQACDEGPTLYERYISDLAYFHVNLSGSGKRYIADGGSLISMSVNLSRCTARQRGYDLDNSRVRRGIDSGLEYGESIDNLNIWGLRPLHTATLINNPYLLCYLISKGADLSLKSKPLSYLMPRAMTPREFAEDIELTSDVDVSLVKEILEKNQPAEACSQHQNHNS